MECEKKKKRGAEDGGRMNRKVTKKGNEKMNDPLRVEK